jgi:hypothetical protein
MDDLIWEFEDDAGTAQGEYYINPFLSCCYLHEFKSFKVNEVPKTGRPDPCVHSLSPLCSSHQIVSNATS